MDSDLGNVWHWYWITLCEVHYFQFSLIPIFNFHFLFRWFKWHAGCYGAIANSRLHSSWTIKCRVTNMQQTSFSTKRGEGTERIASWIRNTHRISMEHTNVVTASENLWINHATQFNETVLQQKYNFLCSLFTVCPMTMKDQLPVSQHEIIFY